MMPKDDPMVSNPDSRRRSLLRGMLITGGVLGFPALWGCKQKEPPAGATTSEVPPATEMQPPADIPAAPESAAPAGETSPSTSGLMTKQQAQYQDQPKGDQQCSNCMHFVAESNTCKVVEGPVSPEGWCIVWAKQPA